MYGVVPPSLRGNDTVVCHLLNTDDGFVFGRCIGTISCRCISDRIDKVVS
jgi:hypothetical protein